MKLFINARFLTQPISGVQRYAIECSRQIKELYPESVFVTPHDIINKEVAVELGAVVVGKRTGHKWEQLDLPLYMWKQKSQPLINLANTAPILYGNNYVVIHDLAFFHHPEWNSKSFSTWYNILIPRIAMNSKHVFTVSNTIKNELIEHYKLPPAKISVTYNGLSGIFLKENGAFGAQKEKIILSVGTFNMRKNQDKLIKGFLESEVSNEYKLVLIGDKNKVFADVGLNEQNLKSSSIKVFSNVSDTDLVEFYRKAEVIVSLSEYEGFGIPVLEGLKFGCKVLCSDIPVYRELFGEHAVFCNQKDIKEIALKLNEVVGKPRVFDEDTVSKLLEKYNYMRAAEVIIAAATLGSRKGQK
ncbi:hypothetical protein CJD36_019670 [Flavipsychrobacter stenotrophus]|uniref:Glycosyltransferase family 1 protein n=1 Tax=Flavipsychrobacter stenotrophus TaxID=2077091 RepID=A0A2S7SS57_9BACT|nr:glycosyltransferase family 1 protein [Flavipsychrobacter stenotrophus]PQJ09461.1 hypothetical protein CJD36_019670 [Flavipsychrobacter stenotrophus]